MPFEFLLDYLNFRDVVIKPMFGMFYIYLHGRIILILRQRENDAQLNGIWVASLPPHHKSLRKEIPALTTIATFAGKNESVWLLLPPASKSFETSAIQLCGLIMRGDVRIGKVTAKSRVMRN